MKAIAISFLVIMLTTIGCYGLKQAPAKAYSSNKQTQVTPIQALTEKEIISFDSQIDSQFDWFLSWQDTKILCQPAQIDILSDYEKLVDKHIDMTVIVTTKYVFAYFAQTHIRMLFVRYYDRGLSVPQVQPFCQPTNEEAILWFKSSDEPLIGSEQVYHEKRKYLLKPKIDQKVMPKEIWSVEKKVLFDKLRQSIKSNLQKLECRSAKTLSVVIPDFRLEDPSVYFLVSSKDINDSFIGWAKISKDSEGIYEIVIADKRFPTVNTQNINNSFSRLLREKILQLKVEEMIVNCI